MSAVRKEHERQYLAPDVGSSVQEKPKVVKRKVKKVTKRSYSSLTLLTSLIAGVFLIVIGQLYIDSKVNALHYEVENLKFDISQKQVQNEELYSKIAELSTYSRAMEIANRYGLETQGNIIYIGD